jgi:hypothetical protein
MNELPKHALAADGSYVAAVVAVAQHLHSMTMRGSCNRVACAASNATSM